MCACHPKEEVESANDDMVSESQIELCHCYLEKQKELERMRASLIEQAKRRRTEELNSCPKECSCECDRHQQGLKDGSNCAVHCNQHCPEDDGCMHAKSMTGLPKIQSQNDQSGPSPTIDIETVKNSQVSPATTLEQPLAEKIEETSRRRSSVAQKITSALKFGKSK